MGEGEGGMIGENSIETCILSSVKQIASLAWMHETSAHSSILAGRILWTEEPGGLQSMGS